MELFGMVIIFMFSQLNGELGGKGGAIFDKMSLF